MDAQNYGSFLNFQKIDFSFLAERSIASIELEEEVSTEQPSEPPPSSLKPVSKKPAVQNAPRPCECAACFAEFPNPGFKAKYCLSCEPNDRARQKLEFALKALEPKPEAPPLPICREPKCRKPFVPLFVGAPYCRDCARAYRALQQSMPQRPVKAAGTTPASQRMVALRENAEFEKNLRKELAEAFLKGNLPEGVSVNLRSGTQTIFRLPGGKTLTCHIPQTPAECEAEAAAKAAAKAAQLAAEAKAEAERKRQKAADAEAKAAKAAAKGGKHKKAA